MLPSAVRIRNSWATLEMALFRLLPLFAKLPRKFELLAKLPTKLLEVGNLLWKFPEATAEARYNGPPDSLPLVGTF